MKMQHSKHKPSYRVSKIGSTKSRRKNHNIKAFNNEMYVRVGKTALCEQHHHTKFTKISTDLSIDQHISNQFKYKLTTNKYINHVKAVNSQKHIAIAFEVPHLKRFQLQKIKKQVKNDIKKQFPNM